MTIRPTVQPLIVGDRQTDMDVVSTKDGLFTSERTPNKGNSNAHTVQQGSMVVCNTTLQLITPQKAQAPAQYRPKLYNS
jgi:hypothetical protein